MEIWAWIMIVLIGLLAVISFKWFLDLENRISSENTRLEKFIENTRRDSERELTIIRKALISNNTELKELKTKSQEKEKADEFSADHPNGVVVSYPEYHNINTIYYSYSHNDKVNRVKLSTIPDDEISGWEEAKIKDNLGNIEVINKNNKNEKFIIDKRKAVAVYLLRSK